MSPLTPTQSTTHASFHSPTPSKANPPSPKKVQILLVTRTSVQVSHLSPSLRLHPSSSPFHAPVVISPIPLGTPFLPGSQNLQQLPIVYKLKSELSNLLWVTRCSLRSPPLASLALSLTFHLEASCLLVQMVPQFLFTFRTPPSPLLVQSLKFHSDSSLHPPLKLLDTL